MKDKCPNYRRKTTGLYYFGIKCLNNWGGRRSIGEVSFKHEYSIFRDKSVRDDFVKNNCFGNYKSCKYFIQPIGLR